MLQVPLSRELHLVVMRGDLGGNFVLLWSLLSTEVRFTLFLWSFWRSFKTWLHQQAWTSGGRWTNEVAPLFLTSCHLLFFVLLYLYILMYLLTVLAMLYAAQNCCLVR